MQKKFITISLLALLLSGVHPHYDEPHIELGAVTDTTVYLNLTKIGLFDGAQGSVINAYHLENAVAFSAPTGTALPNETRLTATNGANFLQWVIPSEEGLVAVTTVPSENSVILQAWWEELPPPLVTPNTDDYAYLAFDGVSADTYQLTKGYSTILSVDEYSLYGVALTAGAEFAIKTTADIFGVGDTSFPTYEGNYSENRVGYTLSASTTNFTADYIDAVNTPGESGTSTDGKWIKYFYPSDPGKLKVLVSGTYDIYITFWDDYSWVRIYVIPSVT